tara:strand:+ start:379 stop:792 length:414 start_codon:yes stop_codon:yes gene_type:complete
MVRRRVKRKAPRRSRAVSALNVLESYMYANIMTQSFAGTSVLGLFTSGSDIRAPLASYGGDATFVNADSTVSLAEIISQPDLALQALSANAMANWKYAVGATMVTGISFRLGKKLLRRPISNINRNIMKPLGVGIKL